MTSTDMPRANAQPFTSSAFWDACYKGRIQSPFDENDFRVHVSLQLVRLIESLGLDHKRVCEVGGGDAGLLCHLARKHPSSSFSVIDFSPMGCALASQRAQREKVDLSVHELDLFGHEIARLHRTFDLVISNGVVEHFADLAGVLAAKKALCQPHGRLFTVIPNLSSPIYAKLCRRWSLSVFEDHVAHDLASFINGHLKAGLNPISTGYLGLVEFGMLSMAMAGPEKKTANDRHLYLLLTRLSKGLHFLEHKWRDLPSSRLFSPFIYTVSRQDNA